MTAPQNVGLVAVRAKYGSEVEQRMKNWPLIAEQYALAYDGEVEAEVEAAKKALARVKTDAAYALEQGAIIARQGYESEDLLMVPSAGLLRRAQEAVDDKARKMTEAYLRDREKGLLG